MATPAAVGDDTSWGSTGTHSHADAKEDHPKEDERTRAASTGCVIRDCNGFFLEGKQLGMIPFLADKRRKNMMGIGPILNHLFELSRLNYAI